MVATGTILTDVATPQKQYRPSIWEAVRIMTALGVITLINVITRDDVITAIAALLIFGGIVAWWFLKYWRSMGWL
jgi:hypothetical protein